MYPQLSHGKWHRVIAPLAMSKSIELAKAFFFFGDAAVDETLA